MPHSPRFGFGPFQLDLDDRLLTRDGEVISLRPKATEILVRLVMNAGQLIKKDQLLKEVWPDTFVEESNLSQTIFTLRKALGDDRSEPRYIETVPRRGYRFVAEVRDEEARKNQVEVLPVASTPAIVQQQVVAVLPFLNHTGDPEFDYLADAITDNLINNLSRLSKVHVLSHSAVSAFKTKLLNPQQAGKDLGATAVVCGKLTPRPTGMAIGVELVDASTGWQLWGETFDSDSKDLLALQGAITQDLLRALKPTLTGDTEKQTTARYTENPEAYQSYLEARRECGSYTRSGIEKAIRYFQQAIRLDPNYALAYLGIIDCYLRLATNYFPPEEGSSSCISETNPPSSMVNFRFQWDWKGAERELRRANELHANYPSSLQWYAAYRATQQLYEDTCLINQNHNPSRPSAGSNRSEVIPSQLGSIELTPNEQVQVYCMISRDQIDVGNYEAASRILKPWWLFGNWPVLEGLDQRWCADLLFTCGDLAGCVASTLQFPQGQRHGEELLNGSIALFEQLGFKRRAAEGRIELALCYYRQGLFDLGRATLIRVLQELAVDDSELRSLTLIRLAILERHAGRLQDAVARLTEAARVMDKCGPWAICRCHLELASTYKDLAVSEDATPYFDAAKDYYFKALHGFAAVGNHRYGGIVENNIGFLLLTIGSFNESADHLLRSRTLFEGFDDAVRAAQVNETLARLYIATEQFVSGHQAIQLAVQALELTDGEALLAEALTTSGLVNSKLGRHSQAKKNFESAYRVAERCGDHEGAGRAMLVMIEELGNHLEAEEKSQLSSYLTNLLSLTQQTGLRTRIEKSLAFIQT
jgi:DNA-binding winged helix-turn-helix (wHTH) protein